MSKNNRHFILNVYNVLTKVGIKTMFQEIKELIKKGLEISILNNEKESKNVFFELLSKIELIEQEKHIKQSQKIRETDMPDAERNDSVRTYEKLDEKQKKDMCIVANYFSLFEHYDLYPAYSQDKAFDVASHVLNVKKKTLKNTRDSFDGHNNSHRKGWWQKELSTLLQEVKTSCELLSREEFLAKVKQILKIN